MTMHICETCLSGDLVMRLSLPGQPCRRCGRIPDPTALDRRDVVVLVKEAKRNG